MSSVNDCGCWYRLSCKLSVFTHLNICWLLNSLYCAVITVCICTVYNFVGVFLIYTVLSLTSCQVKAAKKQFNILKTHVVYMVMFIL